MTDGADDAESNYAEGDRPCSPGGADHSGSISQDVLGQYVPVCTVDADTSYPLVKLRSAMRACGNTDRGDPFVLGPCHIAMPVKDYESENASEGSNEWLACLRGKGIGLYETVDTGPEQAGGTICQYSGWDHPPYDEGAAYGSYLAGIILGSIFGGLLLILGLWWCCSKRRSHRTSRASEARNKFTSHDQAEAANRKQPQV